MKIKFMYAILFLLFSYSSINSQGLTSITDVPIMKGAWFSEKFTQFIYSTDWEATKSEYMGLYLYEKKFRAFISESYPDKVVDYYQKALSGIRNDKPFTKEEINLLKNSSVSKVRYYVNEFGAWFEWINKIDDNELDRLFLTISSNASYKDEGGNTIFHFSMKKYKKDSEVELPSEDELKAHLYPNVTYLPEESLKNPLMSIHAFLSSDALERILTFYEAKLKVKYKGDSNGGGFFNYNQDSPDYISIERIDSGEYKITYFLSAVE